MKKRIYICKKTCPARKLEDENFMLRQKVAHLEINIEHLKSQVEKTKRNDSPNFRPPIERFWGF